MGSGLLLRKYWLSVSDQEQERRFEARLENPTKRWKLSPMDLASREKWVEYSRARDTLLERTHIPEAPWRVVEGDDKRRARLICIRDLLRSIAYVDTPREPIGLGPRPKADSYARPPTDPSMLVPDEFHGDSD